MNLKVMFSSENMAWSTPQNVFDELHAEFNFNTDVAATHESAKCKHYFTPEIDGLSQNWDGVCFMNPPYGREIGKWIKKAYDEGQKGNTIVCLIPARTDTRYWHDYIQHANEIRFVKGRLKFGDGKNSAPFPSAIVVFGGSENQKIRFVGGTGNGKTN